MNGKSPNESIRINRINLTKKKNNVATVALNNYFFGFVAVSDPPVPKFEAFGR